MNLTNRRRAILPWITVAMSAPAFAGGGALTAGGQDLERPLVLVAVNDVLGSEVDNRGEMLGELVDLVVERSTGRALYGIVAGNGVLGLTGVSVAVPYAELVFRTSDGRFHCDLEPEGVRKLEIFCSDRLQELGRSPDGAGELASAPVQDPYTPLFANAAPVRTEGPIVAVFGWNHDDGLAGQLAVVVRRGEGDEQRFILGPPEFVSKAIGAPLVSGQRIALEAVQASDDVGPLWVAKVVHVGESAVNLRDAQGNPLWNEPCHALMSEIAQRMVCAAGEPVSGVEQLVLDARTGQVVFATVLAGGDVRPIPMRVLSIACGDRLELAKLSKDALNGAPRLLGNEIAELNDPTLRAGIYSFFGVDPGQVLPR